MVRRKPTLTTDGFSYTSILELLENIQVRKGNEVFDVADFGVKFYSRPGIIFGKRTDRYISMVIVKSEYAVISEILAAIGPCATFKAIGFPVVPYLCLSSEMYDNLLPVFDLLPWLGIISYYWKKGDKVIEMTKVPSVVRSRTNCVQDILGPCNLLPTGKLRPRVDIEGGTK